MKSKFELKLLFFLLCRSHVSSIKNGSAISLTSENLLYQWVLGDFFNRVFGFSTSPKRKLKFVVSECSPGIGAVPALAEGLNLSGRAHPAARRVEGNKIVLS